MVSHCPLSTFSQREKCVWLLGQICLHGYALLQVDKPQLEGITPEEPRFGKCLFPIAPQEYLRKIYPRGGGGRDGIREILAGGSGSLVPNGAKQSNARKQVSGKEKIDSPRKSYVLFHPDAKLFLGVTANAVVVSHTVGNAKGQQTAVQASKSGRILQPSEGCQVQFTPSKINAANERQSSLMSNSLMGNCLFSFLSFLFPSPPPLLSCSLQ